MSIQKLVNNYIAYNTWANSKIADWLLTLDTAILYKQASSSFNSIDYTMQHILRVQRYWKSFVGGEDTSSFDWSVNEERAQKNLHDIKVQSAEMESFILNYTEDDLQEVLNLHTPWAKNKLSRYEYILHLVNHSTYHRGQIVTIARGLNITENIPATDYNFFNSRKHE